MATVEALAHCRYVAVPGNHITMLYGNNLPPLVGAITAFLQEDHDAVHSLGRP